ncbi:hypothetical protein BD769DRAFT_1682157 [Suillus cothurnatus]|nr:hypothetical protein BD769DRAFT_1682157 [Suillus cothurnatus]
MHFIILNITPVVLIHLVLFVPGSCHPFNNTLNIALPVRYLLLAVLPSTFESSYYRHCDIFRKLVSACKLCVASSVMFRLSVSVLSECSLLLGSKLKRSSKANHVQHILHNIRVVRSEFSDLSPASVTERLSDIELPSACGRALLPLLCAHFVKIFGAQVANALRHPLPVSYAVLSSPATQIPWMSLSTEELVRRLRRLSIETLADSIHVQWLGRSHPSTHIVFAGYGLPTSE